MYGSRSAAPTPLGTATRHKAWLTVSAQPDAAGCVGCPGAPTAVIWTTTMLHNIHTLNPTCSAKIEKIRFRRAIGLPVVSQKLESSGRQSSIQCRPAERSRGGGGCATGVRVVVIRWHSC